MRIIASHFAIFHKFQTEWEATVITDHNLPFCIFFSDITPEWEATVVGNHTLPGGYGRLPIYHIQMLKFETKSKNTRCGNRSLGVK